MVQISDPESSGLKVQEELFPHGKNSLRENFFFKLPLESKEYCDHIVKYCTFFVTIVLQLKFRPDSAQLGPDNKGRLAPAEIVPLEK